MVFDVSFYASNTISASLKMVLENSKYSSPFIYK